MPGFSQSFDAKSTPNEAETTKPRRTRIRNAKVDAGKAYELKQRGLTYEEIGARFGVSKSGVHSVLARFSALLPGHEQAKHYEDHRATILSALEHRLVEDMLDEDKRAKASLNNVAYSLQQVSNLRRLEQGKATSHVAILQLAAQQADTTDTGD